MVLTMQYLSFLLLLCFLLKFLSYIIIYCLKTPLFSGSIVIVITVIPEKWEVS